MVCEISETAIVSWHEDYFVYKDGGSYTEFNVRVMNQGFEGPVDAQVSLRIIKMPQNVVIHQEAWPMANIDPRSWYARSQPFKINLHEKAARALNYSGNDRRLREGYYAFEAAVSSAHEPADLRYNNINRRTKQIHSTFKEEHEAQGFS